MTSLAFAIPAFWLEVMYSRFAMSHAPAPVTEADYRRAIRAAKKEGSPKVELHLVTGAYFVIYTPTGDTTSLVPEGDIII